MGKNVSPEIKALAHQLTNAVRGEQGEFVQLLEELHPSTINRIVHSCARFQDVRGLHECVGTNSLDLEHPSHIVETCRQFVKTGLRFGICPSDIYAATMVFAKGNIHPHILNDIITTEGSRSDGLAKQVVATSLHKKPPFKPSRRTCMELIRAMLLHGSSMDAIRAIVHGFTGHSWPSITVEQMIAEVRTATDPMTVTESFLPSNTCQKKLIEMGRTYAKTCALCGLGPCVNEAE